MYNIFEQYADNIITYRLNTPLDPTDDKCCPLHAKTISFCFKFVLAYVNPINEPKVLTN